MKRLFFLVLLFFLSVGIIVVRSNRSSAPLLPVPSSDRSALEQKSSGRTSESGDLHAAIWIATAYDIDYPNEPTTSARELKRQCREILDNVQETGFDTVYFQVRPACDALYRSNRFPWSRYLTGTCGQAPSGGFDPLKYWVKQAHKRGLQLEAWINPYRICAGANAESEFQTLPESSPAKQHPDWVVACDGGYYFDPGIPEAQALIVDGVREIVQNYRVDGIQFDDYFYPSPDFDDKDTYSARSNGESLDDWRRSNVNALIQTVSETVHTCAKERDCVFGVSPSGIWKNGSGGADGSDTSGFSHYSDCYADSLAWVQNNWVDYLCPQIYWEIGNDAADFQTLAEWWAEQLGGTDTTLVLGLAGYKIGSTDYGPVWERDGVAEISRQLTLCRDTKGISGVALFSYKNLLAGDDLADIWTDTFSSERN